VHAEDVNAVLSTRRERGIELAKEALLADRSSLAWQAFAACRVADPEAFFLAKGAGAKDIEKAVQYCNTCDVKTLCLLYAVASHETFGIWGGMTPRARRALRSRIKNAHRMTTDILVP